MNALRLLVLVAFLVASGAPAGAGEPASEEEAVTDTRTWDEYGKACLGGAAIGSVVPGFGTAIGCAVAALTEWLVDFETL